MEEEAIELLSRSVEDNVDRPGLMGSPYQSLSRYDLNIVKRGTIPQLERGQSQSIRASAANYFNMCQPKPAHKP